VNEGVGKKMYINDVHNVEKCAFVKEWGLADGF
jgi:hypothetical protein